jgi:hypothetical protein
MKKLHTLTLHRYLIFGLLALLTIPALAGTRESLKYDVYYHWGILWKKAGSGVLSLREEKNAQGETQLHGRLAARSLSIVETIMKVRDTLDTYMTTDYLPLSYEKRTHEGSYNAVEHNSYRYTRKDEGAALAPGNVLSTQVDIRRWRSKKGSDSAHLSTEGVAYDMLSIFYILRRLDFDHMAQGTQRSYPIFSGIKSTPMYIEYRGTETCQLRNGKAYTAHRLELYFKSKDSDHTPLQVWLSSDASHKPLKVIIQLSRIGAIQGEWVE